MTVRSAVPEDVDRLAHVWHDGWHEVHAPILPVELTDARTLDSFVQRLLDALSHTRVVGPAGAPIGLCITNGDELNQLYVDGAARGTGVAAALLMDAEARFTAAGVRRAWLACGIGNDRAARFYEKHGWVRGANVTVQLEIPGAIIPLAVWRYERQLHRRDPQGSQRMQGTD